MIQRFFGTCIVFATLVSMFGSNSIAQVTKPMHTKDDLKTVKLAVESGKAVLLDVREKSEWENGHLKDAKFMPMSELSKTKGESFLKLKIDKKQVVYIHCGAGVRALKACELLKLEGYDVRALKPGFSDLLDAGFPEAK